ncbi:hypothetical protein [Vogesella urethralis]|uniref:hypothetical protein n=1 Tax=Vogesella urethralis TaxID=2592656 RepID=UPI001184F31A|nr:hypothetical protein [Vogesella urethralis]
MPIIETTRAYETLIRHHADGSIGAHHVRIYEVVKDGQVLTSQVQPPVPLSVAGEQGVPLAQVLGEAAAAALLATEKAQAELAAVKAQLAAAQSELEKLKGATA